MTLDRQFLLRHSYQYARYQGLSDADGARYADWFVAEYGDEDEPLQHPIAFAVWNEHGGMDACKRHGVVGCDRLGCGGGTDVDAQLRSMTEQES